MDGKTTLVTATVRLLVFSLFLFANLLLPHSSVLGRLTFACLTQSAERLRRDVRCDFGLIEDKVAMGIFGSLGKGGGEGERDFTPSLAGDLYDEVVEGLRVVIGLDSTFCLDPLSLTPQWYSRSHHSFVIQ